MKRLALAAVTTTLVAGFLTAPPSMAQQKGQDAQSACTELMQGRGMSEEGRPAMHELMQSGKAPEMMDRMMQMARRMGDGDVMAGMSRMMDMMGRMGGMMGPGGMMGGQGGMRGPSQPEPKK